jgi:predicted nucleic acid-binding protein
MIRLFIDANIILDALAVREEHEAAEAMELLILGEQRAVKLLTTPICIGEVLRQVQRSAADKKGLRLQRARRLLTDLLACVEVVPMDEAGFMQGAASPVPNLLAAAQYYAVASASPLDAVVSRDPNYDGHIGVKRISAKQALRLVKRRK